MKILIFYEKNFKIKYFKQYFNSTDYNYIYHFFQFVSSILKKSIQMLRVLLNTFFN